MNLPFLEWSRTPWGKATGGQWRYALRNSLAMCLALWVAFVLELDEPYWALTSAAVVSFPTIGGVISKSIGRIFGSLVGAAASVAIAGHCLNDPWLFTLFIAAWIGLCTYVSNHYQNNVSYAFALAGYTAAIIAFGTVNVTDTQQIFDIAQARVCEVITGILCGGLMMMILPSTSDGEALMTSLRRMQLRLLEHAAMLWQPEVTAQMRTSHEGVIGQILTMNLLRIQAFWSHYRLRRQNNLLNYLLHQQLRITSVISSLRRMLLNWPDRPVNLMPVLTQLLDELRDPATDKYRLARLLQQIAPHDPADYRHRAFWLRLRDFCWLYLRCNRWLRRLESATAVSDLQPPRATSLARHTDSYEAAYNGLRTFLCIVIGCAYWINTQWDAGSAALTLTAISCVLYSSTPSPINSVSTLLKAVLLLSVACFVVKFGLMIQIDDFWVFCAFLFPILVSMQMLKLQNPPYAALWGQLIVFMGSFLTVSNPPSYDYQSFINDNIAKVVGVLLAGLAFQILRPSSDKRKSRRIMGFFAGTLDNFVTFVTFVTFRIMPDWGSTCIRAVIQITNPQKGIDMKVSAIFTSLTLAGFCFAANATTLGNVAVYATEQSQGSMAIGDKTAYTKTFEVSLAKLSADTVDLSKLCLKAYSPDKKEFKLDTVDEVLTSGSLKEGKLVKGIAVFASENDDVLKAALVKISDDCK